MLPVLDQSRATCSASPSGSSSNSRQVELRLSCNHWSKSSSRRARFQRVWGRTTRSATSSTGCRRKALSQSAGVRGADVPMAFRRQRELLRTLNTLKSLKPLKENQPSPGKPREESKSGATCGETKTSARPLRRPGLKRKAGASPRGFVSPHEKEKTKSCNPKEQQSEGHLQAPDQAKKSRRGERATRRKHGGKSRCKGPHQESQERHRNLKMSGCWIPRGRARTCQRGHRQRSSGEDPKCSGRPERVEPTRPKGD